MPSAFPNEQLEGIRTLNKLVSDLFLLDVLAASADLLRSPAPISLLSQI